MEGGPEVERHMDCDNGPLRDVHRFEGQVGIALLLGPESRGDYEAVSLNDPRLCVSGPLPNLLESVTVNYLAPGDRSCGDRPATRSVT